MQSGVHPPLLAGQSPIASNHSSGTTGLRKANSKFKPAISHLGQSPELATTSFRANVTSASGAAPSLLQPFAKTVSPAGANTKSVPAPRRSNVIDLSSEPSLLDLTEQIPRKRVSNSTDFVQGSSSKRLKSVASVEQDDAIQSSDWRTNAGHVSPEQSGLLGSNLQNSRPSCIPSKDSSMVRTSSVSPPVGLSTTPQVQTVMKNVVQQSPQRQSHPDLQHVSVRRCCI
ncbi:hypothetical protein EV401DRAFT_1019825 [Pisolithus croceorrhizus]|nr:hypothetical protein EV401DRAFT_1019825 [Pisolithus croceorrhizus]